MEKVRLGVVGCGAIAQIQHLPHLRELDDRYELVAVCDVSPKLVDLIGTLYQVPGRFTDYRQLLDYELDAVLLCHLDPKTEVALAALAAGRHLFIEKPMCYAVAEADAILEAQHKAARVVMVGYMKQHDPGYRYAQAQVAQIPDVRFIQVNHLHPDNALHLQEFQIYRFDDQPPTLMERFRVQRQRAIKQAIGEASPIARRLFGMLAGSMIHDISSLRGLFGPPRKVAGTEVWRGGNCVTLILAYDDDKRCVASWVDLPQLRDFRETLEVYGGARRVILQFPTGFSRGLPTPVIVQGMDEAGRPWKKEVIVNYQNAFKLELIHFHECIVNDKQPLTDAAGARQDMALVRDIVRFYLEEVGSS